MQLWTILLVLSLFGVVIISAQAPCSGLQNCSACIRTPKCAWCSKPGLDLNKRCFVEGGMSCSGHLQSLSTLYKVTKREKLTEARRMKTSSVSKTSSSSSSWSSWSSSSTSSQIVQIYPQRASLKLRINQAHRINFTYAQAEDYPIDLYYLMDLSKSMEDDKDKLSSLGTKLVSSMNEITSNFRLGFGSFVDKVVMPYVNTVPKNLLEPCPGCAAPYGFRNVMALGSGNATEFADKVRNENVSGNLDAPEGGFDAIMQAVVCREKIGWRDQARRLLVFSTDAGFHYAGDGKLGGIIKPNDGACHLDDSGSYDHSKLQDYPSISQVNLMVKENAINVIFAVTAEQINIYEQLKEHIEGSSSGKLSDDSSNVVDLVREQYDKISSTVEIKDNSSSSVQIKYFTRGIEGKEGEERETNKCAELKVGSRVNFIAEFMATKCPPNKAEWKQTIEIYPVGINESLIVDLELICDCPCENPSDPTYQKESPSCNGVGDLMCGVCKCDDAHFGRSCECDDFQKEAEGVNICRPDKSSVDCTGRGSCVCGTCECEDGFYGKYCECDRTSCNYYNNLLCSGPDHGTCDCGECTCFANWTGKACECSTNNATCIAPNDTRICSGNGECVCGICDCGTEDGHYTGEFCDRLPPTARKCEEYKDCVQCQMYNKGVLKDEECLANCTEFTPIPVDYVEEDKTKGEHLCVYFDEDDCRYKFVYLVTKDGVIIRAQEKLDCPTEVYFLGIVLGVIAAVVLIGLAVLLLWKLLTTIHDRREFAKFEKERMLARWDTGENPIYKQATSTFKNPTYAGK